MVHSRAEQKWNKGKMREKINAKVLFDEDGWLRLQAEVPKVRETPSTATATAPLTSPLLSQRRRLISHALVFVHCHHRTMQMKLVTPSALVERLKINSSLARAACKFLAEEGKIQPVEVHNKQRIYTRVTN